MELVNSNIFITNNVFVVFNFKGPEHSSARPERFLQMTKEDPDTYPVSVKSCWYDQIFVVFYLEKFINFDITTK